MSYSTKLSFSVAKFTIEGAGEGVEQIHPICSAPPRLPGTQMASAPGLSFPSNPFSLSRTPFPNCIFPAQTSVDVVSTNSFSSPASASVSSVSSSSYVHLLFPNPFLLHRNSDSQPAPIIARNLKLEPVMTPSMPPTSHAQSRQRIPNSHVPPISYTTTSLLPPRRPRKPRPDRILASSPFRPRVMAVDRLFSWRTPYSILHDKSLMAELPPALAELAKTSITGAHAISTRSTYAAGILRSNQFCDKWQISEGARMPASYALLCAFIGNYKGAYSGRTIRSWLSGIRAWHLANHAAWYGDDKWVQMARISANKEGSQHKRPLRAPVSIEHLLALQRATTLAATNHFHAAVWAVALVTFFGCRRLGETTVSSISSFDPKLHVLRSAEYVGLHILIFILII